MYVNNSLVISSVRNHTSIPVNTASGGCRKQLSNTSIQFSQRKSTEIKATNLSLWMWGAVKQAISFLMFSSRAPTVTCKDKKVFTLWENSCLSSKKGCENGKESYHSSQASTAPCREQRFWVCESHFSEPLCKPRT